VKRHWRVFTQTIDELIQPFSLVRLQAKIPLADEDARAIEEAFHLPLRRIYDSLLAVGAQWLEHPLARGKDARYRWAEKVDGKKAVMRDFGASDAERQLAQRLIAKGDLTLDKQALGEAGLWYQFGPDDP
jgi:hypothetical protein